MQAYPVHAPFRKKKRQQNGPRIGERESAFTITVADRDGVLIIEENEDHD